MGCCSHFAFVDVLERHILQRTSPKSQRSSESHWVILCIVVKLKWWKKEIWLLEALNKKGSLPATWFSSAGWIACGWSNQVQSPQSNNHTFPFDLGPKCAVIWQSDCSLPHYRLHQQSVVPGRGFRRLPVAGDHVSGLERTTGQPWRARRRGGGHCRGGGHWRGQHHYMGWRHKIWDVRTLVCEWKINLCNSVYNKYYISGLLISDSVKSLSRLWRLRGT